MLFILKEANYKPWLGGSVGWSVVHIAKGCGFDPLLGRVPEATYQCFSLSLKSINISSDED